MSDKYLNFNEISQKVNFTDVLNHLNIPYEKKKGELRGVTDKFKFIINIEKNLFFSTDNQSVRGGVINFLSEYKSIDIRDAALELKETFLDEPKQPKREIPDLELHYTSELSVMGISEELAQQYEIGLVKQKSIMLGRIVFKIYDEGKNHIGYIGWSPQQDNWFFPKNFKRPLYNAHKCAGYEEIIVTANPFDCLKFIAMGHIACASLLGRSMTDKQEETLKQFPKIILIHPEPENILNRLTKVSFVKAPEITKAIRDYSEEEIGRFLK